MNIKRLEEWFCPLCVMVALVFVAAIVVGVMKSVQKPTVCAQAWEDTGFRVPVERLSDEEANAYYDGRKLVNDNQRNYVDQLAKENK